jgi:transposase
VPTSADTSERRHSVLSTRRQWSDAEKRSIVSETRVVGANVSAIARRRGVAQSLIYQWRKLFPAADAEPTFLPVTIAAPARSMAAAPAKPATIEIELAFGRKLRVASDIDVAELRRIIAALEAA